MKTTSSHLIKGVIIVVTLLALSQVWRVGQRTKNDTMRDQPVTTLTQETAGPKPPPGRFSPESVEFIRDVQPPHDPWKDPADPSNLWHQQRRRAREVMIRYNLPPLGR
jgi:hypothetical protein